jgi:hypothetical protein
VAVRTLFFSLLVPIMLQQAPLLLLEPFLLLGLHLSLTFTLECLLLLLMKMQS